MCLYVASSPGSFRGRGKEPDIHCMRICIIAQNSVAKGYCWNTYMYIYDRIRTYIYDFTSSAMPVVIIRNGSCLSCLIQ